MPEKKKSVVPRLRFPEFRDAGEWEVKQIGDFTDCTAGGTPSTLVPAYWGGEIRWMSSGELHMKFVTEVEGRITQEGLKNSSTELIPSNCVLVGLAGQGKTRGTVAINLIEICTNQSIAAIYPNSEFVPEYLYYVLDSRYDELRILSAGDGGRGGLNLTLIRSIPIPLPPLPEQQKVAECLFSLDEVIDLEAQKLEALKAHKKGLMQQLFPCEGETTPRLRFPEFRDAGEWEVKQLGEVCEILDSQRMPITSTDRERGPYPYYGASGIVDYINDYIFDERLILIGEDGAKWGPFEKTAFIVEGKYWVNNHAHVLRSVGINDVVLENFLTMIDISSYITGAAPPKLTLDNLKGIKVPTPSEPLEQQKIADCLASLDEVINLQIQKLDALKDHKKGLMQQLFPQEVD